MKKLLLTLILCISCSALFAQTKKITVFSTIDYLGKVDYGDLKKLLPDSVATKILIDPKKTYNLRKSAHVLLWMSNNGWKLVSAMIEVQGGSSFDGYLMSKDIYLTNAAYTIYVYHVTNSEVKAK